MKMLYCSQRPPCSRPVLGDASEGAAPQAVGLGHKVLIIEDEDSLARNIKEYLEEDGYEIRIAGDGETGLEEFERFRPEVVVLDLRLPGIDGLAVLGQLRARHPRAKVIMMTAHGEAQLATEARRIGASTYMAKPLVLSHLRVAIDRLL